MLVISYRHLCARIHVVLFIYESISRRTDNNSMRSWRNSKRLPAIKRTGQSHILSVQKNMRASRRTGKVQLTGRRSLFRLGMGIRATRKQKGRPEGK
jgi:hypothetical protein